MVDRPRASLLLLAAWGVAAVVLAVGPHPAPADEQSPVPPAGRSVVELPAVELAPLPGPARPELRLLPAGPDPRGAAALSLVALLLLAAPLALAGGSRAAAADGAGAPRPGRAGDPAALRAPPLPA